MPCREGMSSNVDVKLGGCRPVQGQRKHFKNEKNQNYHRRTSESSNSHVEMMHETENYVQTDSQAVECGIFDM